MAKESNKKPITDDSKVTLEEVQGSSNTTLGSDNTPDAKGNDNFVDATGIKDENMPKNVFNTKKVAELVGDGGTSSNAGVSSITRARAVTYSGGAGNIAGDNSATVKGVSPRKSGDRPGRTLDTALKHIDDVPAETYTVPLTTIPQLRDGASAVGYNGNYENEHSISQKGNGGSPASNKFFRTLDVMQYDNLYFTEGQYNAIDDQELEVASYNVKT